MDEEFHDFLPGELLSCAICGIALIHAVDKIHFVSYKRPDGKYDMTAACRDCKFIYPSEMKCQM